MRMQTAEIGDSIAVLLALLGYEITVPTTDLLLRKYTQDTLFLHRMICMISRRASHFELQVRDYQEARRGICGVGCDLL